MATSGFKESLTMRTDSAHGNHILKEELDESGSRRRWPQNHRATRSIDIGTGGPSSRLVRLERNERGNMEPRRSVKNLTKTQNQNCGIAPLVGSPKNLNALPLFHGGVTDSRHSSTPVTASSPPRNPVSVSTPRIIAQWPHRVRPVAQVRHPDCNVPAQNRAAIGSLH